MSNVYQIFPCHIVSPCDTFQCHERSAYFIGKPDAPKNTLTKVCEKCASELVSHIVKNHAAVEVNADPVPNVSEGDSLPFEPSIEDLLEIGGKLIVDMNLKDLKAACKSLGLSGYSDKNREELIALLDEATNHLAVEQHEKDQL